MEKEESKKFYWIKLRTDFFSEDEIDFLLSQKNGCEYVVLYQMLCLKTANTNGKLQKELGEIIIPYNVEKIVRDTKYFDFDTVTVALELYKRLSLIYIDENGILVINNHENMIGSETSSAKRIREWREKKKQENLLQCNENVTVNVTQENRDRDRDRDRDKSIENREKSIDPRDRERTYTAVIDCYTQNDELKNALLSFVEMRKKMKGFTIHALELNLKTLDKLAVDDYTKTLIVNQSVENAWKTFYALRNNQNSFSGKFNQKPVETAAERMERIMREHGMMSEGENL